MNFHCTWAQLSAKEWEEDINFLQGELEIRHANLYHSISKDSLTFHFDSLKSKLNKLDDLTIKFELAKILAKIGDGHTGYALHTTEYKDALYLPLNLIKLDNSFAVINSSEDNKNTIGQELIKIGRFDIETLSQRARPFILNDNKYGRDKLLENFLTLDSFLKHLGVKTRNGTIQVTLKNSDGNITETKLKMVSSEQLQSFSQPAQKFSGIKWLRTTDKKFYAQTIDDIILYVQLNSSDIGRGDEESMESLVKEVVKKSAEKKYPKSSWI